MVYNKKAISPVVATALLLVVAVVAVVGFQTWFNTYQSEQLSDIEAFAEAGSAVTLERLEVNGVYIFNRGTATLNVTQIEVGGVECDIQPVAGQDDPGIVPPGVHRIPCGSASFTQGRAEDVLIVAAGQGVFTFTGIVRANTE